jgi:hypothetical protein
MGMLSCKPDNPNAPIAHSSLPDKLARAAFCIMREGVPLIPEKTFG